MGRRDSDSGNSGSPMIYYMKFVGPYSGYYEEMRQQAEIINQKEKEKLPLPIPQSNR